MPLHSVINGALRCQVMTKRTKLRCKNPAAYGCKACRMHGAHKSRDVPRGAEHSNYKNGDRTSAAEERYRRAAISLLTLRDMGDSMGMFNGGSIRGRRPKGYRKLDMSNPEELAKAILATMAVSEE